LGIAQFSLTPVDGAVCSSHLLKDGAGCVIDYLTGPRSRPFGWTAVQRNGANLSTGSKLSMATPSARRQRPCHCLRGLGRDSRAASSSRLVVPVFNIARERGFRRCVPTVSVARRFRGWTIPHRSASRSRVPGRSAARARRPDEAPKYWRRIVPPKRRRVSSNPTPIPEGLAAIRYGGVGGRIDGSNKITQTLEFF
jgi:hypothetical protein